MGDSEEGRREHVSAVLKALRLLDCFSHAEPELTLAELARRTELNKTTAYRLLGTLETAGWLERSADGGDRLTLRLFELGSIVVDRIDLRQEAGPVMSELVARTGETAYLTVIDGLNALCLERVEGRQLVRVLALDVGKTLPLTTGGGPLAMLAYRPELLADILARELPRPTPASIGDEATLRSRIEEVRARGYAVSREDVTPGVCAVGAPVFGADGRVVAALSVSGLAPRFPVSREPEIGHELTRAAGLLSVRLGYRPQPPEVPR